MLHKKQSQLGPQPGAYVLDNVRHMDNYRRKPESDNTKDNTKKRAWRLKESARRTYIAIGIAAAMIGVSVGINSIIGLPIPNPPPLINAIGAAERSTNPASSPEWYKTLDIGTKSLLSEGVSKYYYYPQDPQSSLPIFAEAAYNAKAEGNETAASMIGSLIVEIDNQIGSYSLQSDPSTSYTWYKRGLSDALYYDQNPKQSEIGMADAQLSNAKSQFGTFLGIPYGNRAAAEVATLKAYSIAERYGLTDQANEAIKELSVIRRN